MIEGYWDDDFSRARNAALEHCSGDWIAWLDADETLVCDDIAGLLALLEHADPNVDGFSVPIDNLTGVGRRVRVRPLGLPTVPAGSL